jgi:hypothetical protein
MGVAVFGYLVACVFALMWLAERDTRKEVEEAFEERDTCPCGRK